MRVNRITCGSCLFLLLLISCRGPVPQPQQDANPTQEVSPNAENTSMQMKGINLFMHRRIPIAGAPGKPELWVKADNFSILEDRKYSFEKAVAVIYARDGQEITLEATRGHFEEDKEAALEGDVQLTAGTLKMILSDIRWIRDETNESGGGIIETSNPVIIDDPDLQLTAAGMILNPDLRIFELTNVSGVVRFGKGLL